MSGMSTRQVAYDAMLAVKEARDIDDTDYALADAIHNALAALSSPETTPAPDAGPATDPLCSSCAHPLHADFCPQWVPVQVVSCACAARLAALPQPGEPTCDFPLSDGRVCTRLAGHDGVHQ